MMTKLETEMREMLDQDYVSFVQLGRIEGFRGSGDKSRVLLHPERPNVVIWGDVSMEAEEILQRIISGEDYYLESTTVLTYVIDGAAPDLPIAKKGRKYKRVHWWPCVVRKGKPPKKARTER